MEPGLTKLPVQSKCIWCPNEGQDVEFDISHVVRYALRNELQILPLGTVCKQCNQKFGRDLERTLLDDPIVALYAAGHGRRLAPRSLPLIEQMYQDATKTIESKQVRRIDIAMAVADNHLTFDLNYEVNGNVSSATIPIDTQREP